MSLTRSWCLSEYIRTDEDPRLDSFRFCFDPGHTRSSPISGCGDRVLPVRTDVRDLTLRHPSSISGVVTSKTTFHSANEMRAGREQRLVVDWFET